MEPFSVGSLISVSKKDWGEHQGLVDRLVETAKQALRRPKVSVLVHRDGFVEVVGDARVQVRLVHVPDTSASCAMVDRYLDHKGAGDLEARTLALGNTKLCLTDQSLAQAVADKAHLAALKRLEAT